MKYLFFILLISNVFCQSKYYVIQAVVKADFTKPNDDINEGDTLYYVIEDSTYTRLGNTDGHMYYLVYGGPLRPDYPEGTLRASISLDDCHSGIYGGSAPWLLSMEGDCKKSGELLKIKESLSDIYSYEAIGYLYDVYNSLPIAGVDFDTKPSIDTAVVQIPIQDTITIHDTIYIQEDCRVLNLYEKSIDNTFNPIIRYDVKGRQ